MFQGLICLGLALLAAAPVLASGRAADRIVPVDPRHLATTITTGFLLGNEFPPGATIVGNTSVLRGSLAYDPVSGEFTFAPLTDFWTLGTDRFTYTARHPTTGETSIGVVMLIGTTASVFDSSEIFDDPDMMETPWSIQEIEGVATVAAGRLTIMGTVGLPNEAEANVHRPHFAGAVRGLAQGGKANGTGGSPPPQPPPGGPGSLLDAPWSFVLMRGAPSFGNNAPFWVELRPAQTGDDVRLVWRDIQDNVYFGDWHWVGPSPHEYELNWWDSGLAPKVMLWVDHKLVDEQAVETLAAVDKFEMGVLSPHPVTGSGLQIDDVSLFSWGTDWADDRPVARVEMQVVESLEDGSAYPLTLVGPAQISSTTPLNGIKDLRFEALGQNAKVEFVPAAGNERKSWNARFRFRADGLQIPLGTTVTIAESFDQNRANNPVKVQIRPTDAGGYQVRVLALTNGGASYAAGPWGHLSGLATNVEVQWWTSRSEGFDTGGARVWVNGTVRSEVRNLANRTHRVSGFQLGLIGPPSTVTGHARFDTIQTWTDLE